MDPPRSAENRGPLSSVAFLLCAALTLAILFGSCMFEVFPNLSSRSPTIKPALAANVALNGSPLSTPLHRGGGLFQFAGYRTFPRSYQPKQTGLQVTGGPSDVISDGYTDDVDYETDEGYGGEPSEDECDEEEGHQKDVDAYGSGGAERMGSAKSNDALSPLRTEMFRVLVGAAMGFVGPSTGRSGLASEKGKSDRVTTKWMCPSDHEMVAKLRVVKSGDQTPLSAMKARKAKEIILSDPCRKHLLSGIEQVAEAVRVTLGPRGRNVLLEKEYGPPVIVNDGVTIARNIELKDRRENAGAKLVQEVATTSDDRAGDGTTSTTILTAEICREGIKQVNLGHNPIPLQKGISRASKLLMNEVKRLAKPVAGKQDLMNIATVATSGNAVMGGVIAEAFHKLGANAATILEENPALEDTLRFTEGYTFERGYGSPYFLVGEERDMIEWGSPAMLICDYKVESAQSILNILELFVKSKEPLVIIADDFGPEAMQTLIINKMRGLLKVAAIKAPSFGERRKDYLRDICLASNATLISKEIGLALEDMTPQMLGSANSITIRKERTSIVTHGEFKPTIDSRIDQLKNERDLSTSKYDREKFDERIAALSGGIARIMIGAATETEQKEKRLRYEDAISAVRAGMESGFVPGGGVTYLAVARPEFREAVLKEIEEETQKELLGEKDSVSLGVTPKDSEVESEVSLQKLGADIVIKAMDSITKQIGDNAGVNGTGIVKRIRESEQPFGFGWNAKSSQFGDMIKMGVIDPAKVIIAAIENSASVAGLVLTTEGMMVELEDNSSKGKGQSGSDSSGNGYDSEDD